MDGKELILVSDDEMLGAVEGKFNGRFDGVNDVSILGLELGRTVGESVDIAFEGHKVG